MTATGTPLRADVVGLEPPGLRGIRCAGCERSSFPHRDLCPHCGSDAVTAIVLADRARVVSWTVVHQAPPPLQTPYTLATVDFPDGVRVLGVAVGDIAVDAAVTVELFPAKHATEGHPLWWYRFRATEEN